MLIEVARDKMVSLKMARRPRPSRYGGIAIRGLVNGLDAAGDEAEAPAWEN